MIVPAGSVRNFEGGKIVTGDDLDVWERRLEEQVEADTTVRETDREAIVRDGAARVFLSSVSCVSKPAAASRVLIIPAIFSQATVSLGATPQTRND